MPTGNERWRDVERLYHQALEQAEGERRAFLQEVCAGDEALRQAVESLLSAHQEAGAFLEIPALELAARALAEPAVAREEEANLLAHLGAALADRYAIEREVGQGGMATVYLAQDLKHNRPVALKVLRSELAPLVSDRFLREVRVTARLNHPHILPLLDSGEADGFVYYTMPYVEGESLRDRLEREQQLPLDDAIRIAREVADALSYAHSHDLVHRDIKPENILLESGHAVVADFGIARAITAASGDRLTETGIAVGTPMYMSPEQGAGSQEVNGRSDLYSLGCVLYEMLAGHPPFTGRTAQEVLARHSMDAVPRITAARPTVPAAVEQAILAVLAKSPADRFATANRFADALGAGAEIASSRAVAGWGRPRRRLALGATVVVGVVGVVAGAAILARRHGAADIGAGSSVVVMPFENRTAVTELDPLGTVVAEWVTQGLTELPFLTVLDTRGAQAAARRLGAAATPAAVRRETGAKVVVAGSYVLQGDGLQFQAQISSTTEGSILLSIAGVTAPRNLPMAAVEALRQRVLAAFASLHNKDVSRFQAVLAQPPLYAAYRDYVEGLELYMAGDNAEAVRRFQRAATLDPTFLTARIWTAQSDMFAGMDVGEAWARRVDSLISGLRPLRDRLAPYDRARLDFVVALRAGDLLEGYRASLRLVDAAPGSIDARREVALSALRALHPREALRRLEELDPKSGFMRGWEGDYWYFASSARHRLGEHEEELAAIRRARQFYPAEPFILFDELRALAALGRIAEVDSMARAELPGSGHADLFAFGIAGELMAHGHPEAVQRLARYVSDHPGPPPPSDPVAAREWLHHHLALQADMGIPFCYLAEGLRTRSVVQRARDEWVYSRAELALLLGDAETAARYAAQLHDPDAYGPLLARILAAQGKVGAARAALEHWGARMVRALGTLRGLELDRASVLVRIGDLDRALKVLSEGIGLRAFPNSTTSWDGHAYPDFAPLFGDPRFKALVKPRG
ncbi:MAG TPA: protein kinase [Gemmatimonadales bacterium]|jgi:tetratricopeptide (TPR) repeat protein